MKNPVSRIAKRIPASSSSVRACLIFSIGRDVLYLPQSLRISQCFKPCRLRSPIATWRSSSISSVVTAKRMRDEESLASAWATLADSATPVSTNALLDMRATVLEIITVANDESWN